MARAEKGTKTTNHDFKAGDEVAVFDESNRKWVAAGALTGEVTKNGDNWDVSADAWRGIVSGADKIRKIKNYDRDSIESGSYMLQLNFGPNGEEQYDLMPTIGTGAESVLGVDVKVIEKWKAVEAAEQKVEDFINTVKAEGHLEAKQFLQSAGELRAKLEKAQALFGGLESWGDKGGKDVETISATVDALSKEVAQNVESFTTGVEAAVKAADESMENSLRQTIASGFEARLEAAGAITSAKTAAGSKPGKGGGAAIDEGIKAEVLAGMINELYDPRLTGVQTFLKGEYEQKIGKKLKTAGAVGSLTSEQKAEIGVRAMDELLKEYLTIPDEAKDAGGFDLEKEKGDLKKKIGELRKDFTERKNTVDERALDIELVRLERALTVGVSEDRLKKELLLGWDNVGQIQAASERRKASKEAKPAEVERELRLPVAVVMDLLMDKKDVVVGAREAIFISNKSEEGVADLLKNIFNNTALANELRLELQRRGIKDWNNFVREWKEEYAGLAAKVLMEQAKIDKRKALAREVGSPTSIQEMSARAATTLVLVGGGGGVGFLLAGPAGISAGMAAGGALKGLLRKIPFFGKMGEKSSDEFKADERRYAESEVSRDLAGVGGINSGGFFDLNNPEEAKLLRGFSIDLAKALEGAARLKKAQKLLPERVASKVVAEGKSGEKLGTIGRDRFVEMVENYKRERGVMPSDADKAGFILQALEYEKDQTQEKPEEAGKGTVGERIASLLDGYGGKKGVKAEAVVGATVGLTLGLMAAGGVLPGMALGGLGMARELAAARGEAKKQKELENKVGILVQEMKDILEDKRERERKYRGTKFADEDEVAMTAKMEELRNAIGISRLEKPLSPEQEAMLSSIFRKESARMTLAKDELKIKAELLELRNNPKLTPAEASLRSGPMWKEVQAVLRDAQDYGLGLLNSRRELTKIEIGKLKDRAKEVAKKVEENGKATAAAVKRRSGSGEQMFDKVVTPKTLLIAGGVVAALGVGDIARDRFAHYDFSDTSRRSDSDSAERPAVPPGVVLPDAGTPDSSTDASADVGPDDSSKADDDDGSAGVRRGVLGGSDRVSAVGAAVDKSDGGTAVDARSVAAEKAAEQKLAAERKATENVLTRVKEIRDLIYRYAQKENLNNGGVIAYLVKDKKIKSDVITTEANKWVETNKPMLASAESYQATGDLPEELLKYLMEKFAPGEKISIALTETTRGLREAAAGDAYLGYLHGYVGEAKGKDGREKTEQAEKAKGILTQAWAKMAPRGSQQYFLKVLGLLGGMTTLPENEAEMRKWLTNLSDTMESSHLLPTPNHPIMFPDLTGESKEVWFYKGENAPAGKVVLGKDYQLSIGAIKGDPTYGLLRIVADSNTTSMYGTIVLGPDGRLAYKAVKGLKNGTVAKQFYALEMGSSGRMKLGEGTGQEMPAK